MGLLISSVAASPDQMECTFDHPEFAAARKSLAPRQRCANCNAKLKVKRRSATCVRARWPAPPAVAMLEARLKATQAAQKAARCKSKWLGILIPP